MKFNSLIPELSVSDIDRSKEFYLAIGFEIMYEREEDKFCFLKLEGNQIMIEQVNDNWNTGVLEYPFGRGINISMSVSDVSSFYENVKGCGVKLFKELEVNRYRVGEEVYEDKEFLVQDPDGYLLRFND